MKNNNKKTKIYLPTTDPEIVVQDIAISLIPFNTLKSIENEIEYFDICMFLQDTDQSLYDSVIFLLTNCLDNRLTFLIYRDFLKYIVSKYYKNNSKISEIIKTCEELSIRKSCPSKDEIETVYNMVDVREEKVFDIIFRNFISISINKTKNNDDQDKLLRLIGYYIKFTINEYIKNNPPLNNITWEEIVTMRDSTKKDSLIDKWNTESYKKTKPIYLKTQIMIINTLISHLKNNLNKQENYRSNEKI